MDLLADHAEVLAAAETGSARLHSPPFAVYRLHMTLLLREADPHCNADYLAEALLACLGVDFFLFLGDAREMRLKQLKAGWRELVRKLMPSAAERPTPPVTC